ncbi:Uncharacterised protein [Vibrio cholerae]|nr:Uncharacterised protein [Vibrio cholerae]
MQYSRLSVLFVVWMKCYFRMVLHQPKVILFAMRECRVPAVVATNIPQTSIISWFSGIVSKRVMYY